MAVSMNNVDAGEHVRENIYSMVIFHKEQLEKKKKCSLLKQEHKSCTNYEGKKRLK